MKKASICSLGKFGTRWNSFNIGQKRWVANTTLNLSILQGKEVGKWGMNVQSSYQKNGRINICINQRDGKKKKKKSEPLFHSSFTFKTMQYSHK